MSEKNFSRVYVFEKYVEQTQRQNVAQKRCRTEF